MSVTATSLAAKRSLKPSVSRDHKRQIVSLLISRKHMGATLDEMQSLTGIKLQTLCARRKELEEMGLVVDSGNRRKTTSGRTATVWIVPTAVAKRAIERGW